MASADIKVTNGSAAFKTDTHKNRNIIIIRLKNMFFIIF
ncbi:hypothetical protein BN891_20450 [Bacteroides xylanisolvens SD CC 2a]|nr:hypothetical protein BN891_20450 [Bacteroides xylanisolvens SD CC 2a]